MDDKLKSALDEQRHRELIDAMMGVQKVFSGLNMEAPVKELARNSQEIIIKFTKKLEDITGQKAPEVNVNIDQEPLLVSVNELKGVMEKVLLKIDELIKLENAEKNEQWVFDLVKNGFGVTTSVKAKNKYENVDDRISIIIREDEDIIQIIKIFLQCR